MDNPTIGSHTNPFGDTRIVIQIDNDGTIWWEENTIPRGRSTPEEWKTWLTVDKYPPTAI